MKSPVRLTPSLREKVWGRTHLEPWFRNAANPIGEAWFLADRDLPLLVKLIFTAERLSVQVHPDDGEDGPRGKTEMWHILEADPGATIALGFRRTVARDELGQAARSGAVEDLLNWFEVKPGDTYFTPAHTVHAIGAGIVLCEIQQNSDVTYRLWDYGRPRPIHLEQAVPICDLTVHPGPVVPRKIAEGREELVRDRHFVTESVCLAPGSRHTPEPQDSQIWICLEGTGSIGGESFVRGDVWLMPEPAPVAATESARFLRTYVPF